MKNIGYKPQDIRDVAKMIGIISEGNCHLKLSNPEIAGMIAGYVDSLERRIEKAKIAYRQQKEKLDRLEKPELWRFAAPESVPPDYREEYLRRLKDGKVKPVSENGVRLVKTKGGMIENHE